MTSFTHDSRSLAETYDRVSGSRTDATGSGLGLAIARKRVELHGGKIEALSEGVGTGSCSP